MADTFYDAASYVEKYNDTNTKFAINRKDEVHRFIQNNNIKVNSLLDLASGTGLFLQLMQKDLQIERCVGLDYSEKMIKFSNENIENKHIKFVYGDMTNYDLNEQFDMITCNYDAINHIESFDGWKNMFKLAHKHLNDGGYFIFDYNTVLKLKDFKMTSYMQRETYNMVFKTNSDNGTLNFNIFMYNLRPDGLYELEKIGISESVFPNKDVKNALVEAGFNDIKFCDEKFNKKNPNKLARAFVVCRK